MATKEDISMIVQALEKLAKKYPDPYLEDRGFMHRHKLEYENEDGYRFEERTSFENQYD